MANISKIKISGASYSIKDENACKVVELTQAEYDALPASAKTSNSLFVITDATAGDLSNYYTKTETDGLLDTKLDVTAYTPTDLSNYYTKSETSGATEISTALSSKADTATTYTKTETDNAITAATSTKQDTLVSGTNIKTINNESILGSGNITIQGGSGGGKALIAGTNISITTGETADTINCTLPITLIKQKASTFGDKDNLTIFNLNETNEIKHTGTTDNIIIGHSNKIGNDYDPSSNNFILGNYNNLNQGLSGNNPKFNFIVGDNNTIGKSYRENVRYTALFGTYLTPKNNYEYDFGKYNNSVSGSSTFGDSGNTLFSVGNGTADNARHNAFEIRQNGDIYITKDGQDVKLQDQLGGGSGGGITSSDVQTMIDESISGKTNQNDNLFTIRTNVIEAVIISGGKNIRIIFAFDIIQNNQIVLSTDTVNDKSSLLSALATLGFDNKIYDITGINYSDDTSNTSYFGEFLGHKCYEVLLSYVPNFGSITIGLKRNDVYYTLDSVSNGKYNYNYLDNKPEITTSVTSSSTDAQVPSAKAVYDMVGNINTILESI